jgi:hypothetical protein
MKTVHKIIIVILILVLVIGGVYLGYKWKTQKVKPKQAFDWGMPDKYVYTKQPSIKLKTENTITLVIINKLNSNSNFIAKINKKICKENEVNLSFSYDDKTFSIKPGGHKIIEVTFLNPKEEEGTCIYTATIINQETNEIYEESSFFVSAIT